MTDADNNTHNLRPTRRQLLVALGGGAALVLGGQAESADVDDVSGGSTTGAANAMQTGGGLFIGPAQLRKTVDSAPGRAFAAVDEMPPKLHDGGGSLSHSVVARGSSLPAFTAPTESELAVPPETPAIAVVDDAGVRVATGDSFATSQQYGDTQMTRARSIHVAEQITDLPTPSETPAIGVTVQEGAVVFS